MLNEIYYLPGFGGRLHTGLGQALNERGYALFGRETVGEFRNLTFSEQIAVVADDLHTRCWRSDAQVIANSFGGVSAPARTNAVARLCRPRSAFVTHRGRIRKPGANDDF